MLSDCILADAQPLFTCPAGKPVFGTLIALLQDGVPVLGVIDQPITKERWIGVKGQGTTLNGELFTEILNYHLLLRCFRQGNYSFGILSLPRLYKLVHN